jgi:D-alanine-D-alanine ligase
LNSAVAHDLHTAAKTATRAPTLVWVLAPLVETNDPTLDYYNDYSTARAEYQRAFQALDVEWRWQPITTGDHRRVIDQLVAESAGSYPVVFNLCDGDETNGAPGQSVIQYLRELGVTYTGADEHFYTATTSKIDMKRAFDRAGVPTAAWEPVAPVARKLRGIFHRCGTPLIIKPAVSAGSMGITVSSVVTSESELLKQLRSLSAGYRGWDLASAGVLAERFIAGPEYTTFIVGSADASNGCTVYPSVERVFHSALPPTEQFLSFDRLWEVYEHETPLADGQYLWEYQPVSPAIDRRLRDVSLAAYRSVGGHGYGRVDLRMDAATGELYVLEVNAQCGLSEDENYTSIGAILRFAGRSFAELVSEIIDAAQPI